jgi:hypothetical protein
MLPPQYLSAALKFTREFREFIVNGPARSEHLADFRQILNLKKSRQRSCTIKQVVGGTQPVAAIEPCTLTQK